MSTDHESVIVEDGLCAHCAVHTKQVHHRDFPELRAECGTVAEAVTHLAGQLSRDREGARSGWHRESIDRAIADVAKFLASLVEAAHVASASCRCGARMAVKRATSRPDAAHPEGREPSEPQPAAHPGVSHPGSETPKPRHR
jgi:hypothetical protein